MPRIPANLAPGVVVLGTEHLILEMSDENLERLITLTKKKATLRFKWSNRDCMVIESLVREYRLVRDELARLKKAA